MNSPVPAECISEKRNSLLGNPNVPKKNQVEFGKTAKLDRLPPPAVNSGLSRLRSASFEGDVREVSKKPRRNDLMQADMPEEADQSLDEVFNRRDTAEIDRAVAEAPRSSTFDEAAGDPLSIKIQISRWRTRTSTSKKVTMNT